MSNYYHEENTPDSFFNKDVVKLLFKYILRYRSHLYLAFLFVSIITTVTLIVPYLSRITIDRYIVKSGYILKHDKISATHSRDFEKLLSKSIVLKDDTLFTFKNNLSGLSTDEIRRLTAQGTLSESTFTLIESPAVDSKLKKKISEAQASEVLWAFPNNRYLLKDNSSFFFTVSETAQLRIQDIRQTGFMVLIILGLFILQFAASYFQIITLMKLSQYAMRDLRIDLFSHITSLELSFFDRNPIGKLVNRITNDIESLNELFSTVLVTLVQDVLILTGITIIMFFTDHHLALVVSISFPALFVVMLLFRIKARQAYRVIRTRISDLNSFLNENISNIRIIQVFVQELRQFNKFKLINGLVYKANFKQVIIYAIFRPLIDFFKWFTIGLVIYVGTTLFLEGTISYGLIVMFLAYINSFFEPIGDLAEKFDILQSATAAGEKILTVLNAPCRKEPVLHSKPELLLPENQLRGEIVFDDVWFCYTPGEWVLKGVSFSVPARSTLAIVGESGSGKSTIINLISGFYPISKGKILIDGIDITEISPGWLRSNIATVMQDVFLFSRTIRENIIMGKTWNESRFQQVTTLTHASKFLQRLPHGADQNVMERGVTFSAGERQLLAFTRALYFDPSILILDEATSNIDTETEVLIQDAISQLIKGRTSIVIAHRLSTVRSAEKILVLNKGQIAEFGDHDTLMRFKGLYYEFFRLQFEKTT
jgi:ATP-binding cassette subfamily B protein/subfamily B ATP-binding cassette protein MsbA